MNSGLLRQNEEGRLSPVQSWEEHQAKVDARMRDEQRALEQQHQMNNEIQLGIDQERKVAGQQLEF